MIKIIDCGSQLTQNIARRIRELGVFSEIVPYHTKTIDILSKNLEGIIISGGQFSVYDKNAPIYEKKVLESKVPILGICYGQQSIAYLLGGKVVSSENREYGETIVKRIKPSKLFKNLPSVEFKVYMSHGDIVKNPPKGFEIIALSQNNQVAAMQKGNIYAVQFHPEVDHTENGRKILENFVDICGAKKDWDPTKDYDRIIAEASKKIKGKIGIGGISGGVDSSVVSVLINKLAGKNYHPIFVDNGLLRKDEAKQVMESLKPFNLDVHYIDAGERFLSKLKGVVDPDEKRRIIGHEFINVFSEIAKNIGGVKYLVQGTLYPDVIESVPVYGSSSKIKRHHNVGGLPENMELELVEPFRNMFKDEVRRLAESKLGMPKEIVWRHPFPGPGLAVRIIGEVTPEKLSILREADAIFIEELKNRNIYYDVSQAFAVLTDSQSVGVMGDEGTYEGIIGLRAVTTNDFMTSDWYNFKKKDLTAIANRIINNVKGVNRVVYDISQKPPATIEWE
ncbi:MAG: glutamine-hydrolyzing GMP synthase [Nanoarchaeota archaeon]|nr:glutamine-hydrolyzing GMP synthase [Nanoarchaeota archaeon]MBU1269667.1 glutamine-hydrolyzing GMP synthase [Nanoarchaeota archaeon]MBU1603793.1 glutamine-hydrolyzing GMP synthase [Nanoarchaeota archaeon]MBU2443744.1 glutamine-hydrolyzing GMP synthase [Nanoarchaeota archaeon]